MMDTYKRLAIRVQRTERFHGTCEIAPQIAESVERKRIHDELDLLIGRVRYVPKGEQVKKFIRLTLWTASFEQIEERARHYGGWPTNSKYECRNGLFSHVGFHFPEGVPDDFVSDVASLDATETRPAVEFTP